MKEPARILKRLHETHYLNHKGYSPATSSHWRQYGEQQSCLPHGDDYVFSGTGFGDFEKATLLIRLKRVAVSYYVCKMLRDCSPDVVETARTHARITGRFFSYDVARLALTLNLFQKHLVAGLNNKTVVIIGDGYGTMGSLIKLHYPQAQIVHINLGRTLFADAYYTIKSFPGAMHQLMGPGASCCPDFNYIAAESLGERVIHGDVFINTASMQEMDPETAQNYFSIIRGQQAETFFYCCNRVEKTLPDGTVTRFFDYDWRETDEILVDELCPWQQEFPQTRPPFKGQFDGPVHHRLIRIAH